MKTPRPKKKPVKRLTKGLTPRISVALIEAKTSKKTIIPESLDVFRKGYVVWVVVNKEQSGSLKVEIGNLFAQKPNSPSKPIETSGPVDVAAGEIGLIYAAVNDKGKGMDRLPYSYNVIIDGNSIDPEIVVCDDPGPLPPFAKKTARKKAVKKRTTRK